VDFHRSESLREVVGLKVYRHRVECEEFGQREFTFMVKDGLVRVIESYGNTSRELGSNIPLDGLIACAVSWLSEPTASSKHEANRRAASGH